MMDWSGEDRVHTEAHNVETGMYPLRETDRKQDLKKEDSRWRKERITVNFLKNFSHCSFLISCPQLYSEANKSLRMNVSQESES